MHCASRCSNEDRAFILGLMNRSGSYAGDEVARLRRLIEATGSLEYARRKVLRYTNEAKRALKSVPACRAKSLLRDLTDYLASRYS